MNFNIWEDFQICISVPLKFQIHAYLKICYISLLPSVISFAWWMIMVCIVFWRCSFILFWSFSILIPYRKLAGVEFEPRPRAYRAHSLTTPLSYLAKR